MLLALQSTHKFSYYIGYRQPQLLMKFKLSTSAKRRTVLNLNAAAK